VSVSCVRVTATDAADTFTLWRQPPTHADTLAVAVNESARRLEPANLDAGEHVLVGATANAAPQVPNLVLALSLA